MVEKIFLSFVFFVSFENHVILIPLLLPTLTLKAAEQNELCHFLKLRFPLSRTRHRTEQVKACGLTEVMAPPWWE